MDIFKTLRRGSRGGAISGRFVRTAGKVDGTEQLNTKDAVTPRDSSCPLNTPRDEQEGSCWRWSRGRLITPCDVGPQGVAKKMVMQY